MSGAAAITAVAAATAAAYSVYSGERAAGAQKDAARKSEANALKAEKASDEATNRANMKRPDTRAIMDAAAQAGKAGPSSTMLTGPQGVDTSALQLGRTTLLGG